MDARCVNDSTLSSTKPAASSKGKMFSLGGFSTRQNLQRTLIEEIQNQFGLSAEAAGDGDVINDVFTLSADSARSLPVEILSRKEVHAFGEEINFAINPNQFQDHNFRRYSPAKNELEVWSFNGYTAPDDIMQLYEANAEVPGDHAADYPARATQNQVDNYVRHLPDPGAGGGGSGASPDSAKVVQAAVATSNMSKELQQAFSKQVSHSLC
jgi:hypothetical protein